jgi:glycosyltransferase involved in cell wall biosynthesis
MHIGIDGGCWNNRRGYGRFFRELLDALAKNDTHNNYTIFLDPPSYRNFPNRERFRPRLVETGRSVSEAATAEGRRSVMDLARMGWAVAREDLDLFFFPSVYSYFPLFRPVPAVVGIHDTIADRNPQFAFSSRRHELFWRWKVRLALAQARTVLTVSEYSKRCMQQWLGVPANRIRVMYEAASPRFQRARSHESGPAYILYVGGISPNKNLATLIRAFSRLQARARGVRLILVGDYQLDGFKSCYSELNGLVQNLSLSDEVQFTGFVPDEELCRLYNGAGLFVLPSFDEGFGLPAIEAMACGLPVIVSAGNAMEEIVGGAGVIVDPHDEGALAAQMDRLLGDAPLRRELGERAVQRAAEFSWDSAARNLLGIFEDARDGKLRG